MKLGIIVALLILALGLAGITVGIQLKNTVSAVATANREEMLKSLPTQITVPKFVGKDTNKQELATLSATAILVSDNQENFVLYNNAGGELRYPASTMKLMTALVARKVYKLDQVLTVREEAFSTGTNTGFQVGEQLKVKDLLAALLLNSGNDAAFVLANNAPGGYQKFVDEMNATATTLSLRHTHFSNASGLDNDTQQSTAEDLMKLTRAALADDVIRELVGTKKVKITDTSGLISHDLVNRNELLGTVPEVFGVKTGTTESAGENLITALHQGNRDIVVVLLGSEARYLETLEVLKWITTHYRWETREVLLH